MASDDQSYERYAIDVARSAEMQVDDGDESTGALKENLTHLSVLIAQLGAALRNIEYLSAQDRKYILGSEFHRLAELELPPSLRSSVRRLFEIAQEDGPAPFRQFIDQIRTLQLELQNWKTFYQKPLVMETEAMTPVRTEAAEEERRVLSIILIFIPTVSGAFIVWDMHRRHPVGSQVEWLGAICIACAIVAYGTDLIASLSRIFARAGR